MLFVIMLGDEIVATVNGIGKAYDIYTKLLPFADDLGCDACLVSYETGEILDAYLVE